MTKGRVFLAGSRAQVSFCRRIQKEQRRAWLKIREKEGTGNELVVDKQGDLRDNDLGEENVGMRN